MTEILQEKWIKGIAITTTVLAVVASISGSRSAFFVAKAQLLTALEGSKWSYYQAKSIKRELAELQQKDFEVVLLGSTSPEQRDILNKIIESHKADIIRYDAEKIEIMADAQSTGKENAEVVRRGSQFSLSVVFAQIGIMLSSVGALIKRRDMWIIGLIIGVISIIYMANGFLLIF